jgi:hypothetical protein
MSRKSDLAIRRPPARLWYLLPAALRLAGVTAGLAAAPVTAVLTTTLVLGVLGRPAAAGEADDLQAMIDRARNGVTDLERLDEKGAARDEVAVLRNWLDESWRLRSEHKYDDVRIVLDRCDAQAEMIRQKIQASKLVAQAVEKEEKVARQRADNDKTRKAIEQARLLKASLEGKTR